MTESAPARVVPPPSTEEIDQRAAERELLIDKVTAASKTLDKITTIYGYDLLDAPLALPGYPGRLFVRITVTVVRYPGATAESKRDGKITVTGYHRQQTYRGVRQQSTMGTPVRLPEGLALPMIVRALTVA